MIIAVDKPIGPTSHDVVASARRQLGTRKVGHAGTLDPLASGVLLLLSDEHTRLSSFLTASHKSYLAWVSFGATTPTLDAEGPLEQTPRPPDPDVQQLAGNLAALLPGFLQLTEQVPPSYSAIKRAGVKGYEAARRGEAQELPARPAGYLSVELLAVAHNLAGLPSSFAPTEAGNWAAAAQGRSFSLPGELASLPTGLFRLQVEAGTYIRAFARDLGEQLGCGAFLAGLVRTGAGRVDLQHTVAADQLAAAESLDPLSVLAHPVVQLDDREAERVRQGQRLSAGFDGVAALVDPQGRMAAMAQVEAGRMKLLAVFPVPA